MNTSDEIRDALLGFDGGLTLRVFPDQANADEGDNYAIEADGNTYILAAQSTLYRE